MTCPPCGGTLKEGKLRECRLIPVEKCGGVWLDAGELEQLTQREKGGWLSGLLHRGDD
jgi:Zn-finger nucleic acid-binding protein